MLKKLITTGSAFSLSIALVTGAHAAVSVQEANKLGNSLTPFGAIKEGNGAEIPAWTGGISRGDIPPSYTRPGQHHPDPFANDRIVRTIDNNNKGQYANRLTEGTKALMATYPDTFRINVYPSRRTTAAPQWVYDNVKKNATTAKLTETGVINAIGGIPFPILHGTSEEKALQAIWNHMLRWRGVYLVRSASEVAVQRNGNYSLTTSQQEVYFPYNDPNVTPTDLENIIFYYLSFTTAPARLAGGAVLLHETLDQGMVPRQAWGYNAGTRRVQRSPSHAYDTPIAASEGLRTVDDTDMYNGAPDKYNWRLVHDQPVEMYIPYNNYRLSYNDLKYDDILQLGHINSEYPRWELHRVWVVEATLKPRERHVYHKRVFYIDADSWQIASIDKYDRRGDLWRVSMAYIKNYYEVPAQWTGLEVFYDLKSQRYNVQQLMNEERSTIDFTQPVPNKNYFSPAALRRRGR